LETPDADEYLNEVRAGANGVSVEFAPIGKSSQAKGITIHRRARIGAMAGALTPAYDGSRVMARDEMEGNGMDATAVLETPEPTPDPEPTPEPTPPEPSQGERKRAEMETLRDTGSPARITRSEFIYRPETGHRFLNDVVLAARGDIAAAERQDRHYRQLDEIAVLMTRAQDVLSSEISGAYPTEFLPGLLLGRDIKGRPMGGFFSRVPITDARPRTFPKVTTSTSVAVQSAEAVNPALSDFATTPETAQPLLYGGGTKVSRQVLDGADPAAEAMIMSDLMEAYAQTSETVIAVATEAAATAGTAAITLATPHDGLVEAITEFFGARFLPAQAVFAPAAVYANLAKQKDGSGRPLVPYLGPTNADGQLEAGSAGASVVGVPVALSWASAAGVVTIARSTDMVIYESAVARFSYEQVDGPAAIRLGIWAYLAAADRKAARKHTAA
jgi:hypothetical protein